MRPFLFWFMAASACSLAAGCGQRFSTASADDDFGPVKEFSLTERSGRTVSRADLLGKVWVAAFTFTRCPGPCAQISGSMARLQKECAGEDRLTLVSFTVDPDYDTPKVLQEYANRFGADPERWLFLTGKPDNVYRLIRESFRLTVERTEGAAQTAEGGVVHSTKLALVDRRGHVRGYFDGTRPDELQRLEHQITLLAQGD
jgi:protein SCO1/2